MNIWQQIEAEWRRNLPAILAGNDPFDHEPLYNGKAEAPPSIRDVVRDAVLAKLPATGYARVPIRALAYDAGVSETTALTHLAALVRSGVFLRCGRARAVRFARGPLA